MNKNRLRLELSKETLRLLTNAKGGDPKEIGPSWDAYCPSGALVGCSVDVCPKPPVY